LHSYLIAPQHAARCLLQRKDSHFTTRITKAFLQKKLAWLASGFAKWWKRYLSSQYLFFVTLGWLYAIVAVIIILIALPGYYSLTSVIKVRYWKIQCV
jgi:hypothetical protein